MSFRWATISLNFDICYVIDWMAVSSTEKLVATKTKFNSPKMIFLCVCRWMDGWMVVVSQAIIYHHQQHVLPDKPTGHWSCSSTTTVSSSLLAVLVERNETKAVHPSYDPDYNNNYVIRVRLKKNFVAFSVCCNLNHFWVVMSLDKTNTGGMDK